MAFIYEPRCEICGGVIPTAYKPEVYLFVTICPACAAREEQADRAANQPKTQARLV